MAFKCLARERAHGAGSASFVFMILSGHDSVTPQDFDFPTVVNSTKCRFRLIHWIAFNRVWCRSSLIAPVSVGLVVNANSVSSLSRFRSCVPSRREPLKTSTARQTTLVAPRK